MVRFRILVPGIMLLMSAIACNMSTKDSSSSHPPNPPATAWVNQSTTPTATVAAVAATATTSTAQTVNSTTNSTTTNTTTRTCTPPSGWVVYRVVSGDTLSVLAERIGTTTNALATANCLADASRIDVGQTLYLPSLPPAATGSNQTGGTSNYLQVLANMAASNNQPVIAGCALPSRLFVGGFGRYAPGAPVNVAVYPSPGYTSSPMVSVTDSDIFTVIAGPQCLSGVNWWQITFSGVTGWIVEGDPNGYSVEPTIPGQNCAASTLAVNVQAQPVPDARNDMYTGPSAHGAWAYLGEIPNGTVFTIVAGPTCAENVNWWQVSYNAITGWIMETQNGNMLITRYP